MKTISSLEELRRRFPTEARARSFLERMIWPTGRVCPHCGTIDRSWAIKSKAARPGLYECQDCGRQFTVTTKTPMHATKLDIRVWLQAMYLMLTSSKGVSSVVISRLLGVHQSTAWKMNHALRRMISANLDLDGKLQGMVEVDEKFVGAKPKKSAAKPSPRGKGSKRTKLLVATGRDGRARACIMRSWNTQDIENAVVSIVDEKATTLLTDSAKHYRVIARTRFSGRHMFVKHSAKEFARSEDGISVHSNGAEAFGGLVARAQVGVFHHFSNDHLPKYLDEIAFRWSHREWVPVKRRQNVVISKLRPTPFIRLLPILLRTAVGQQTRWTKLGSVRHL